MSNENSSGNAIRTASAIANIAKGAISGGIAGAAVGAVKSFLPEILKAAAIIIATLILLPLLIFAALPNILFGYDNSSTTDVIEFTNKAHSIDAAYKEVQNYSQDEVDKLIEALKAAYTSEDGSQDFDEVEVNTDTENTNIYWFIAITSVAHKQDLYTMNEETIKDMIISKLVSSASILSRIIGEGDETETIRTLKIDIKDLNPEELMDKLGFSDEERNWAQVLYSSLSEEQRVDIADSDGAGYYGTDYGSITFADAATPVVYYNQTDSRWGGIMYGKTDNIAGAGCGPTALAIVVATFMDSSITPKEVAEWSVDNGYRVEGNGSYHSLITDGGAHYGLTVEAIGNDGNKLVEALKDGKLAIAIMAKGHFTKRGHFIVLRGVTSDGKILVADPASYNRSNQEWDLTLILNETSRRAGAGGPIWILS